MTITMSVKRKREVADKSEDESTELSLKAVKKKHCEELKTAMSLPVASLPAASKKLSRPGQKMRKALRSIKQDAVLSKPLSKGEKLINLIRKRKVEHALKSDGSDPVFKIQKSLNGINGGTDELDSEEYDDNFVKLGTESTSKTNTEELEEPVQDNLPFDVKRFRKSLSASHKIVALRGFVKQMNRWRSGEGEDVVNMYILNGGSPLEILNVLETRDTTDLIQAELVFKAVNILFMKGLTDSPSLKPSCEEACRHILNAYLPIIQKMISERASSQERKVAMKILTSIVSMNSMFACDVLASIRFPQPIQKCLAQTISPRDNDNVRTCFIHFLMALLVEENIDIIKPLLEVQGLLSSIIPGLIYDQAAIVHFVLTTLRTSVVESLAVNKTQKLIIFNTTMVIALIKLYEWKGPRSFHKTHSAKTGRVSSVEVGQEERGLVIDALDPLLTVLCTSHKFGVVFVDRSLGTSGARLNELMWKVLIMMERPWERDQLRNLVVRILAACPDLISGQMQYVGQFLEPRPSPNYEQAVGYVRQVLEALSTEALVPHLLALKYNQLKSAVQQLCAPLAVVNVICTSDTMLHEDLAVRHMALSLLRTMLHQVDKFLLALNESQTTTNKIKVSKLKYNLTWLFPSGKLLLESWQLSTSASLNPSADDSSVAKLSPVSMSEHLVLLLDLLGLYFRVCPHKLEAGDRVKLSLQQLSADISRIKEEHRETGMELVQVKAIQVAMAADVMAFQADKETFSSSLLLLLRSHGRSSAADPAITSDLLKAVLTATGLFRHSPGEQDIWLHSIRSQPLELQDTIVSLLTKSLVRAVKQIDKYSNVIADAEIAAGMMQVKEELEAENQEEAKEDQHLSPLLPCMLKHIKDTDIGNTEFLNVVLVHLLHWLEKPEVLLHVVTDKLMYFNVKQYIVSWLDTTMSPTALGAPFNQETPEHKLSQGILRRAQMQNTDESADITSHEPILENNSKKQQAFEFIYLMEMDDPIHLRLLFDLTLFHLTKLILREELTKASSKTCETVLKTLLLAQRKHGDSTQDIIDQCLKNLFSRQVLMQSFDPFDEKSKVNGLATKLIFGIISWIRSSSFSPKNQLDILLEPYKDRLVASIKADASLSQTKASSLELTNDKWKKLSLLKIVEMFELDFSKINSLLDKLSSMPLRVFMTSKCTMTVWGNLAALLLQRVASLHRQDRSLSMALVADHVEQLSSIIAGLYTRKVSSRRAFEESFLAYLRHFPHSLKNVHPQLFLNLLNTQNPSKMVIDTAVFLLARKPILGNAFSSYASNLSTEQLQQRTQILFPLLSLLISAKRTLPKGFDLKLYECFEKDLIEGLTCPVNAKPWLKDNTTAVSYMINACMSDASRTNVCTDIQEHITNHYNCQKSHIELIERIFSSSNSCVLTTVLLQIMTNSTSNNTLDGICSIILKQDKHSCTWETLKKSEVWSKFTIHALKLGLKPAQEDCNSALLLETLSSLCQVVYTPEEKHKDIVRLFQMTSSHSEFLNVMLGSTPTKLRLIELLKTFIDKNKSVISAAQIPVLLGSYNASLSLTDQVILQLLKTYETNNVSLNEYRPYLWGKSAVNHFCITSKKASSLWRQPSAGQVLDLFRSTMMKETVAKFPLNRKLNLELCNSQPTIYDPSFFLPLFSQVLSSDSVVQCYKFIQNGCLALTLASLASNSKSIRAAAYNVITRLHFHLEGVRGSKDKKWWLQFLDAVRNGVVDLNDENPGPQLACIVSTFLARTSLHTSQPLDPMFVPLTRFIIAKSAIDLNTIPELFILFHSTELQSQLYRQWLLEVIRDGMRLKYDWKICLSTLFFKLLFVFYSSVVGSQDTTSRILTLAIINNAVKLPGIAHQLASSNGLFPWLHEVVRNLKNHNVDLIMGVVRIAVSLWGVENVKKEEKVAHSEAVKMSSYRFNVTLLLVALIPLMPKTIPVSELKQYLATIEESAAAENETINLEHLTLLVKFVKEVIGNVGDCEDLLEFGCKFAAKDVVQEADIDDAESVKQSLRNAIIVLSEEKKLQSRPISERLVTRSSDPMSQVKTKRRHNKQRKAVL